MHTRNESKLRACLGLLCMIFLIYIGNTLFKRARIDFTEENLYTLSDGSINILKKLDTPVELKLFYSKTAANKGTEGLREFNNHFLYVEDLLNQYVSHSKNKLTLEVIDPRPDTPDEENAMAFGLRKFSLSQTESYFFGLVAISENGTEKIIEFFDPNQKDRLEYELTKLIYTTMNPQKKTIGVLSSLDVMKEELAPAMMQIMRLQGKNLEGSWTSIKLLEEFHKIKKIDSQVETISGIDTLVIIHPQGFNEKTLFAIDQYMMKGGNLLLMLDPNFIAAGTMTGLSSSPDAAFQKLMDKWGLEVKSGEYVGDKYLSAMGNAGFGSAPQRMLGLLNCNQNCTNDLNEPISSGIQNALMVYPGEVKTLDKEGVTHSTLLRTTPRGNTYQAQPYEISNPQILWSKFEEGDTPKVLMTKTLGRFKSAFPDGIEGLKEKDQIIKESSKESAIITLADVDFLHNQFSFKQTFLGMARANDNSSLFMNAIEALSGNKDLMNVRSKQSIDRGFNVIREIELEAQARTENKVNEINANIARFQKELNDLGLKANASNIALIQNEGVRKKKELNKKIGMLKKELREVKREGRERVESIGKVLQYLNTLFVPVVLIFFGLLYNRKKTSRIHSKLNQSKQINLKEVQA